MNILPVPTTIYIHNILCIYIYVNVNVNENKDKKREMVLENRAKRGCRGGRREQDNEDGLNQIIERCILPRP